MNRIEDLQLAWNAVCSAYLARLAENWEWDVKSYGWWVGDEIGEVFAYGDNTFIGMDNIRYCVDNNISWVEYAQWEDYCLRVRDISDRLATPNFQSWQKGCPRYSEEQLQRLEWCMKNLEEAIDSEILYCRPRTKTTEQ